MSDQPVHLKITLPVIVALVIAGGAWTSSCTQDPHWLNRSGALVAAIAAGAILLQIKAELQLEAERERVESRMRDLSLEPTAATPVGDLELRLEANRLELKRARLARQRLTVAAFVVGGAILGELLHGFGDLLMCYSLGICAGH